MDSCRGILSLAHDVPAEFVDYAKRVCKEGPIICDVGSRDAAEAMYLCGILHASECHIFEPNPAAARACEANIAKYAGACRVSFNRVAVSDRVGVVPFRPVNTEKSQNKDLGFSSLFAINPAYASKRRGRIVQDLIEVSAVTLDSYFEIIHRWPDLLWIDAEGAEKLILNGGEKTLGRVALIHIEVGFRPMQIGRALFWEVDAALKEAGFRRHKFVGVSPVKAFLAVHRLLPNPPWRWNAIYCRSGSFA